MVRLLAVADSDSYLKWSAATLAALPPDYQPTQVVVASPLTPSSAQIRAVAPEPVRVVTAGELSRLVQEEQPDVVLLAATGPVVATLTQRIAPLLGDRRPVLVTGLPGISYPASRRAVELRQGCDLLVVHSRRERDAYAALAADVTADVTVGLGRLPFLPDRLRQPVSGGRDVIFAAQAKVPPSLDQRRATLLALASAEPAGRAVVKLRAAPGESETHHDRLPYRRVWDDMAAEGLVPADSVRFTHAPIPQVLDQARACVTVSSTAALEAMAAGVGVLLINDFGISSKMINRVFIGSGCFGSLADLSSGRFHRPAETWLADNYFHPWVESDWLDKLSALVDQRSCGRLPQRSAAWAGGHAAELRRRLRLSWIGRKR